MYFEYMDLQHGCAEPFLRHLFGKRLPELLCREHDLQERKRGHVPGLRPVSYTHLDVYKRQIELGAGFDMDLTARENIFLNGAVLGHDRDYMICLLYTSRCV